MKKFAILRKDKTILVKTPIPYVVSSYVHSEKDVLTHVRHELNEHTKFLYNCLKMLGISKKQAITNHFTLNIETGDMLIRIASQKDNISHEVRMLILNHNW